MTDAKDTTIQVKDTIENLNHNLNVIHAKAQELEQCLIGVATFVRYGIKVEEFETMLDYVLDQAGNVDSWTDHVAMQYSRMHCMDD